MSITAASRVVAAGIGLAACSPAAARAPRTEPITLTIGGGKIEVEIGEGHLDASRAELTTWITTAASAVTEYFGRFPVARYRISIQPARGEVGVRSGTTWATGGAHTRMVVGEHTSVEQLAHDWVMTHEMAHTAFPDKPPSHLWIEEGISTYVEPLGRSWIGNVPAAKVWTDLVEGLPNGLPRDGDHGLDRTHTWGRTYWGGALFCLLADLEIRERTRGARGLVDALRGMVAAGGNDQAEWSIERAFAEADKAVGGPVLEELYARMKDAPVAVDLDELWRGLGVSVRRGALELDDAAPRAAIRRAISARPAIGGAASPGSRSAASGRAGTSP
jgi:hypothetical protein